MLKLDDLRDAINLYRGAVQFSVPLASLPGASESGFTLRLSYDSSSIDETVVNWNLSHPTGLAGLGWQLTRDCITINNSGDLGSDHAVSEQGITLHLSGVDYQLAQTGGSAVAYTYVTDPYQFWNITYIPATETWTVVLEDGTRLTFGDLASGRNTVDWGYAWNNWSGASVNAAQRTSVAVGWSLAQSVDVWGSGYTFTYTQTTTNLGSNPAVPYTQATYLVRVDSSLGGALTLSYQDKLPVEYQNPHGGADAVAWQSRFATQVLVSVSEIAAGGATLAVTTLQYTGTGNTMAAIGTGNFTKRLLMGIARTVPGGYSLPDVRFAYDVNPTSDSYGALLSITTPAGGSAVLGYTRPTLPLPRRDQALVPSGTAGVTYDTPRIFWGRDSTLVLWHGSDNSVAATAYRWEGRWLAASVVVASASDITAYNQLRVAMGVQCFAIVGATDYTLFHQDPNMPGAWVGSTAPEPLGLPSGEAIALATGSGYVALLATQTGAMIVRWFDGAAWQASDVPASPGTQWAALDGHDDLLLRLSSTGNGPEHDLLLMQPDPSQGWQMRSLLLSSWLPALDGLSIAASETYAVATLMGWSGPNRIVHYHALWWGTSSQGIESALLKTRSMLPPATSSTAQIREATVLIDQDVYRFDGSTWRHQDLSLLTHPNQQQVTQLTLGADIVTRTVQFSTNIIIYDAITYNAADTSATPWSYAAGMNGIAAKSGTATATMAARFGSGEPGAASRYLLFNNQLFQLSGDGTWTNLLDITSPFSSSTIASLLLYANTYLIYQTDAGVEVYPLRGGGLAIDSGITLANARLLIDNNQPLTGETAFVAYTGTWGQPGAALTLYRPVAEDVRGALTPLMATSITLYGSGLPSSVGTLPYNATPYIYECDTTTATVSQDGRRLAANKAILAIGMTTTTQTSNGAVAAYFFNGLSAGETPTLPYPTDSNFTNAATYVAHLDGVPYSEFAFAQNQSAPSSTETAWWWVTGVRVNARSIATYWRCRKIAQSVDGVPASRSMTYSSDTGLLAQITATTAGGQAVQTSYTYWWEKYDPTRTLNLLTPIVQCMETSDGILSRGTVITWTNSWGTGSSQWAPRATYVAINATPAPFTAWTGTPNPLPTGWALSEQINARTLASFVQVTQDALGQKASSLMSRDGLRRVASFANADIFGQEVYYYGFEPYEDPGLWLYQGGAIEDHLVAGEANLGTRSLEIAPDTTNQTGPTSTWVPLEQSRSYLFSCWVQTSANFDTVSGTAQFEVTVYTVADSPQVVGSPLLLPLPSTNGTWQYVSLAIPLGTLRAQNAIPTATKTSITILGYSQKTGAQVLVDGLRFQPVDATFFAQVFDPQTYLPLGSLEANGATYHLIRDENRIVTATVGPELSVARLSIPSFARLLTADQTYDETLPNTSLECSAGSSAIYQNFEASDIGQWLLPTGWTIANGQLTFSGTAPTPRGSQATLKAFTSSSFVAYVRYLPPTTGNQPNVGIGCGNVLVYYNAATTTWVLSTQVGQQWQDQPLRTTPLERGDLVFALLDGRVSFFAGGQQLFSGVLPTGTTADGTLNLYLTGNGAFQELVALIDPELRLVMIDGRGVAQQAINLRDTMQVEASGLIADTSGLPDYYKNPVYVSVAESGNRLLGGVASYLPPVGGQPQTLEHYLAYGNGSPFMHTVVEQSPLARPQYLGLAGDDLAVGGQHATQFAYTQNTANGPMTGLVPDNQASNYRLVTVTDPDQAASYALVSPEGTTAAERVMLSTNEALTTGYSYDAAGRLVTAKPPNAFAEGAVSGWETVYHRDFQGRIVSIVSPDSGTTQFAYDSLGRLRFRQDAASASQTPPIIAYYKYDGLDRIIEVGILQQSAVTWATAQAQVDAFSWPGADLTPTILQTVSYDVGSGSLPLAYTEGRITEVSTYKANGVVGTLETYSYDRRGNVVSYWTMAPDYAATVWISTYSYDSRNRILRVDYPRATTDGQPPLSVIYAYDRLGHITSVGQAPPSFIDPLDPPADLSALYGSFSYNADNSLAAASYNNQPQGAVPFPIEYTYTAAGWQLTMTTPVYSEAITYTSGGFANSGYYDGQVASVASTWRKAADALYPLRSYTATFAYDASGRVTAATPYLAPPTTQPSALPISYDLNGNLNTVQRSSVTETYHYPTATAGDQLQSIISQLTTTCNFESPPAQGWTWGAADGGPDGATVINGGPPGSIYCLNISGSLPAASGYLEYRGPIDPNGQYTLTYWIKADAAFANQQGDVSWYLVFHAAQGPVATVMVQALTSVTTTWTQVSTVFDIHAHYVVEAMSTQVIELSILLRNNKRSTDGSAGAAIQIAQLSLTGSGGISALSYDPSGRITTVPASGLSQMTYDTQSNALVSFQTAADGGYGIEIALNAIGQNTTQILNSNLSNPRRALTGNVAAVATALTLRAPNGLPLARFDQQGGTVRQRYFIAGPQGIFAVEDDGQHCYLVRGYDNTIRAVANNQGQLIQYYDYDAFGRLRQSYGGPPVLPEAPDALSGLDLTDSGTYLPPLGRDTSPTLAQFPQWNEQTPDTLLAGGYALTLLRQGWAQGMAAFSYSQSLITETAVAFGAVAASTAAFVQRWSMISANLYHMHFIEAREYMSHNPDVWFLHTQTIGWNPNDWAVYGILLAAPFTTNPLWGVSIGLAGYYAPQWGYGIWRFGYIKLLQSSCAARSLKPIINEALVEDIYHFQFFTSSEAVGGKRLRHRNSETISDGYYFFVINENNEFIYRDMYGREGSTPLYVRHSMLNGGECARCAGMFSILGKEIIITNQSGHYGFDLAALDLARDFLLKAGYEDYVIKIFSFETISLKEYMKQYLKARKQL